MTFLFITHRDLSNDTRIYLIIKKKFCPYLVVRGDPLPDKIKKLIFFILHIFIKKFSRIVKLILPVILKLKTGSIGFSKKLE